ncbi:hypothetical protein FLAG1_11081, partial [Fusarium langsethiae]
DVAEVDSHVSDSDFEAAPDEPTAPVKDSLKYLIDQIFDPPGSEFVFSITSACVFVLNFNLENFYILSCVVQLHQREGSQGPPDMSCLEANWGKSIKTAIDIQGDECHNLIRPGPKLRQPQQAYLRDYVGYWIS